MAGSKKDDKVFDVADPGTAKPSIGSKPMIVGHKSIASDPMVKKSHPIAEDSPSDKSKLDPPSAVKKTIQPISSDMKLPAADDKPTEAGKDKITPESTAVEDKTEKPEASPEPRRKPMTPGKSIVDELESKTEPGSNKDQDKAVDAETLALDREDNLRNVIESKKYNVVIKESDSNSAASFVVAFLSIILIGAVAVYLLMDFGIIDLGIELPVSVSGNN